MSTIVTRATRAVAGVVLVGSLGVLSVAQGAGAQSSPGSPGYTVLPLHNAGGQAVHVLPTGGGLPLWSSSIVAGQNGQSYNYNMVGENPMVAQSNQTTTINVPVVPLIIKFKKHHVTSTFDPTSVSCAETSSPMSTIGASPMFNNVTYTPGGTNVGTTQYEDAFQRANFWTYTNPTGINPNYHVLLNEVVEPAVTLTVPSGKAKLFSSGCGALGEVNVNWFDAKLQSTLIPALGTGPSTFPVYVTHNVVLDQGASCCYLGYHSAYTPGAQLQTYAYVDFDDSGEFGPSVADISAMAHEFGEWMDDPEGTNPTPAWGHIGQVTGCQSNLEVGDPLSGNNINVVLGGVTYHPQELAFFSWFYDQAPSSGVNGWYSNNDTFTAFAARCT